NALNRSKIGAMLSLRELLDIETLLRNTVALKSYRDNCEENKTDLDDLFYTLVPIKDLADNIKSSIISEEELDDNASGDLKNIRRAIKKAQANIRTNLDKIIHNTTFQKYLQENIITMRDGRFVVPVKSEYRNEIKGLVHDTSASGATVFIEPLAVVEENNVVKLLEQKEKQEIERIILALSGQVGDNSDIISENYRAILALDVVFAKAKYALQIDATAPTITDDGKINLIKAKHPLIDRKIFVPINISLGMDFDTLIVTGPNTGGKTVSLKTMGLLTLMVMCGIMIPVHQSSSVSVFGKVLASIGDEQSIEQNLSTFSSQMTKIVGIINHADKNSLVILDELGSGTDPIEGAALAIAIIEKLSKIGAKIAATTHYPELKLYALTTDGVENACCEFDVASLRPTYKLLIGVPGKSNAFEISKKLGLADEIIDNARGKVSEENTEFEDVVSRLENTRQQIETEKEETERIKRECEYLQNQLNAEKKSLENKVNIEIERARAKAKTILEQTRYKSDEIINELEDIKKNKAVDDLSLAKSKSNKILGEIEDIANPVDKKTGNEYKLPRNLKRGDIVIDSVFNQQGTVLSDPD
ncbi:MAG: endonuclease MutS2, partial [Oscillospiraceae bacterium]